MDERGLKPATTFEEDVPNVVAGFSPRSLLDDCLIQPLHSLYRRSDICRQRAALRHRCRREPWRGKTGSVCEAAVEEGVLRLHICGIDGILNLAADVIECVDRCACDLEAAGTALTDRGDTAVDLNIAAGGSDFKIKVSAGCENPEDLILVVTWNQRRDR